jgi:flagellar biosynthetic protein FliR
MTQSSFEQLIHHLGPGHVTGFFLVLARIAPLFVVAPLFSSQLIPMKVRTIVGVGIGIGLTPIAIHGTHVPSGGLTLVGLMIENGLVGLAVAMAVAAVFAAIETAASLLDVISGFSYGALINPMSGVSGGVLTSLYSLVGLALFIAVGGDAWALRGIARTFTLVPLTSAPDLTSLTGGVVTATSSIFIAAVEVAAPALLALLVTDIAFGMVSRVVPQLNVFAVGFALKIGVALLIVAASLPFLGSFTSNQLTTAVTTALQTIHG